MSAGVNDAEPVALRIDQDDVVSVRRAVGLVGPGGPQGKQPLNVAGLVIAVQVEVHPWTVLHLRGLRAQREVRSLANPWAQDRPVGFGRLAGHVVQGCGPERELGIEIMDPEDNRTDAHVRTVAAAAP